MRAMVHRGPYRVRVEEKDRPLLLAADRVDTVESGLRSFVSRRPDNPVAETGVRSELTHGGLTSRLGRGRRCPGPEAPRPAPMNLHPPTPNERATT
jgi:hypothetical protein